MHRWQCSALRAVASLTLCDVLQAHTGNMASPSALTKIIETDAGKPSTSPSIKSRATGKCEPLEAFASPFP